MKKATLQGAQKQQSTNLIAKSAPIPSPGVSKVKTDGRIGSATPPSYLKGGFTVDNNQKAGPPGPLGSKAANHMSPSMQPGNWSPRAAAARKRLSETGPRPHAHPINLGVKNGVKRVKPD